MSLVGFPLVVLELADLDVSLQSALNFIVCHHAFNFLISGQPPLFRARRSLLGRPYDSSRPAPQPVRVADFLPRITSLALLHRQIFLQRCLTIIDGITEHPKYLNTRFRGWMENIDITVGRLALANRIFDLIPSHYIELLVADEPPTINQLIQLPEHSKGVLRAVYLLLVELTNDPGIRHYIGSSTDQTVGFTKRLGQYLNWTLPGNFQSMPKFIVDYHHKEVEFEVKAVLPMLIVPQIERLDSELGDLRCVVLFTETIMMYWWRSFPEQGAFAKMMAYSPWTDGDFDELDWLQANTNPSTKFEFPSGIPRTDEEIEAINTLTEEERLARNEKAAIRYANWLRTRKRLARSP